MAFAAAHAEPKGTHAFSPLGAAAYPEDFTHFAYVNPNAPKGGALRLGRVETFDSTNTLRYPGSTPADIRIIYDRLVVAAADEPASYYGLLAETIAVADDWRHVTFTLRPEARWHDGKPITSDDVVFTFETLKAQGAPFYRQVLRAVSVEAPNLQTVEFRRDGPPDRNFISLVGTLPVHPVHYWRKRSVADASEAPPVGSGPYRVLSVDPGKTLVLERVSDYWGADLAVNRGRWNFDRIEVDYYRDNRVALEAFKAGDFDLRQETNAILWATGYNGALLRDGQIDKSEFALDMPRRLQTLVFNLRRPSFADRRVRRALALAYDPDFTIETLFAGLYKPLESIFGDSQLAARYTIDDAEQALVNAYLGDLPSEIQASPGPAGMLGRSQRERLSEAAALLDQAGFVVRDGLRIDPGTDAPWRIDLIYREPAMDRVLGPYAQTLEKLGITLDYRTMDPASAARRILDHDFDMTVLGWSPSKLPGLAETLLWGSALADRKGSYALAGAKDPALDAALAAMTAARTEDDLIPAARAFDRVLRHGHYIVPLWQSSSVWVAHQTALRYPPLSGHVPGVIDTWWREADATQ